jgi:hypothetical protein
VRMSGHTGGCSCRKQISSAIWFELVDSHIQRRCDHADDKIRAENKQAGADLQHLEKLGRLKRVAIGNTHFALSCHLNTESGHSIAAIKLSVISLLFFQTKQRVCVLDAVSCVALGF